MGSASKFDICNRALRRLDSAKTIEAFDEGTVESEASGQFYDACRRELLEVHPWKFAATRGELSQTTAVDGWTYAYTLPVTFLRLIEIASNKYFRGSANFDYQRDGRLILTDSQYCWLRYVYDFETTIYFPTKFEEALVARLASRLAGPLKRSRTQAQELLEESEVLLAEAKSDDAGQEPVNTLPESSWVTSRYGGNDTWDS